MKRIKLLFLLMVSSALVLVVLQNTTPVQARFLWLKAKLPVIMLLFLTSAGGFVAGLFAAIMLKGGGISKT